MEAEEAGEDKCERREFVVRVREEKELAVGMKMLMPLIGWQEREGHL